MKLKSIQAKEYIDSYNNLLGQPIPVKVAFKLNKIATAIKNDVDFYNQQTRNIILEYCEKREDGNPVIEDGNIKIMNDKIEECNNKFLELNELEFDAPDDIKFIIEEFEGIKIDLSLMEGLLPFILE